MTLVLSQGSKLTCDPIELQTSRNPEMDLVWDQPAWLCPRDRVQASLSGLAACVDQAPRGLPCARLPPGTGRACLEDVEADGVALAVTAVLAQSDSDAAGPCALRDREGEARVGRVGGEVPAAPRRLADSPRAPQLHGLPLPCGQGLPRGRARGRRLDGTARGRHRRTRLSWAADAHGPPASCPGRSPFLR